RRRTWVWSAWSSFGVLKLTGVARLDERLLVRGLPRLDRAPLLQLRVELRAEQDRDVGDPEPDEEGDHAAERAVGLVVGAEVTDVEGEGGRGDHPDEHRQQTAR